MQAVLPAPSQSQTLVRRAPVAPPAPRPATPRVERRRNTSTFVLTRADDMSMLHSRLERARDRRVTLVLAPDAHVLRRPLEYRVLRRLAEELGLVITIVSGDAESRRVARECGFAVRDPARTARWRLSRTALVGLAVALALATVTSAALPRTTVTLKVGAAPVTQDATITVDLRPGAPGVASGWVAGKTLATTFEIERTMATTGKQAIGVTPAAGYVTLTDLRPYTPPSPPTVDPETYAIIFPDPQAHAPPPERVIPAGTPLVANTGLKFFTQSEARLPPSGFATVPVIAEFAGRAGNVPAGAIDRLEDPNARDLRVENRQGTWGGTDRVDPVVAPEDREALQQELALYAEALAPVHLVDQAGDHSVIVPETATWNFDEQYDYAPGQVAPQLWGRALVRAQAIGMPRKPLDELAGRQWREQLASDLGSAAGPKVAGEPALQETTDDYLVVSLPVEGMVAPHFDGAALAEQFRGQSADAVRARLASLLGLLGTPQVETWPSWAPAALRVDVNFQ